MTSPMTGDEMFESLNGFDEIAIAKAFGRSVQTLAREDEITFLRALTFVDFRRNGRTDAEAHTDAMNLTIGMLNDYFAEAEPEVSAEMPVTEQGKGD